MDTFVGLAGASISLDSGPTFISASLGSTEVIYSKARLQPIRQLILFLKQLLIQGDSEIQPLSQLEIQGVPQMMFLMQVMMVTIPMGILQMIQPIL